MEGSARNRADDRMAEKFSRLNLTDLADDRAAFDKMEHVIHVKGRLAIVSILAAAESLTFTELRDALRLTDGNLMTHLRALYQSGYVSLRKIGGETKHVTLVSLSPEGREAFRP